LNIQKIYCSFAFLFQVCSSTNMQLSNMKCRTNFCNLRFILDGARFLYLVIAIVVVSRGFYKAYRKMIEEDLSYRQEIQFNKTMRYPSVTFCYKYNHGSKKVMDNYFSEFYEKSRNSGKYKYFKQFG